MSVRTGAEPFGGNSAGVVRYGQTVSDVTPFGGGMERARAAPA